MTNSDSSAGLVLQSVLLNGYFIKKYIFLSSFTQCHVVPNPYVLILSHNLLSFNGNSISSPHDVIVSLLKIFGHMQNEFVCLMNGVEIIE